MKMFLVKYLEDDEVIIIIIMLYYQLLQGKNK